MDLALHSARLLLTPLAPADLDKAISSTLQIGGDAFQVLLFGHAILALVIPVVDC